MAVSLPYTCMQYVICFEMSIYVRTYVHIFSEDDKTAHYSIIVLGILTCGTSVLLWWLYKACCGSKEKYNVEGKYVHVYIRMYAWMYKLYILILKAINCIDFYAYICTYIIYVHMYVATYVCLDPRQAEYSHLIGY